MRRFRKQLVRPLILVLVLVLGPLSAQAVYMCPMMGSVVLEKCCCDDHESVRFILDSEHASCCEKSVELHLDGESDQIRTIAKKVDVRSDVDPPVSGPGFDRFQCVAIL